MIMDNRFLVARRRYDPDATRYINAVQLADGQALEPEVAMAVDAFIKGCKADGIWDALKASCILCGARTIAGALVPLAGTAPTGYNFVSANYNRETGLLGVSASNTYIDTNYSATSDPQDDHHISTYITQASALDRHTSGARYNGIPAPLLASGYVTYSYTLNAFVGFGSGVPIGFYGLSRANLSQVEWIKASSAKTISTLAALPFETASNNHCVYAYMAQNNQPHGSKFDGRIAFYSFGRSLNVDALGQRVTTLVSEIAAAIP